MWQLERHTMLPIPAPELVLEAARVVMAERRLESLAEADRLLTEAEEWGAGMCCPEALIEYRQRRAAAQADPAAARRALLRDVSLMLRMARRSVDSGLAAARRTQSPGVRAQEAHEVAASLLALRAAAFLLEASADGANGEIAKASGSGEWDRLEQYFDTINQLWAVRLGSQAA
jgi:hypothetical protein